MNKPFIKNIEHETVLPLESQVEVLKGQIVSKTLTQNESVSITLFAFDKGEEISTHDSEGDAMVFVLSGTARFIVDGKAHIASQGQALIMPAGKPHSVHAPEAFKMLLVVIFPKKKERMSNMKVSIERDGCISCGLCPSICPEVFRMGEDDLAEVYAEPTEDNADSVQEAADSCPSSVIIIE